MIIKALHPDISENQKTFLTAKAEAGENSLVFQNPSNFSLNDYIVIGNPGEELTEIQKISAISGKTITLASNLDNSHPENTQITYIKYNKIRFYKASSKNGSYSLLATKSIAIDEKYTVYDDQTSLPTDYYKITYYNSDTTDESVFSDPIGYSGFKRYTLKKLQDALFKIFGDTKEQFLSRDEITEWVNEIKDDMVNKIIDTNEKYFDNSEDLDVDSNGEADLNENFRKFQKVSVLYDGENAKKASKIEYEDVDDATQTFSQENPYYYFRAYKIGIRPKGTVGTTKIRVIFEDHPDDLESDADELPKPIRFYTHVVMNGLMAKACEKAGKDKRADRYEIKYINGVNEMLEEINNLVLNENREVKDDEDLIFY